MCKYFLQLLMPETMKLLGNTKSKITKNENGENSTLKITYVVLLVDCNTVNNDYRQSCIHFFQKHRLANYQIFHPDVFINKILSFIYQSMGYC